MKLLNGKSGIKCIDCTICKKDTCIEFVFIRENNIEEKRYLNDWEIKDPYKNYLFTKQEYLLILKTVRKSKKFSGIYRLKWDINQVWDQTKDFWQDWNKMTIMKKRMELKNKNIYKEDIILVDSIDYFIRQTSGQESEIQNREDKFIRDNFCEEDLYCESCYSEYQIEFEKKRVIETKRCVEEQKKPKHGKKCSHCDIPFNDEMNYCNNCGTKIKYIKYCSNCEKTVETKYCSTCGEKILL